MRVRKRDRGGRGRGRFDLGRVDVPGCAELRRVATLAGAALDRRPVRRIAPLIVRLRPLGLAVLAGLALLLVLTGACSAPNAASGPPHVILITIDTLRADHLTSYGHPATRTPNLDGLAERGVRFDQVTTAAPTTLASHTSIFTGRYPRAHGVPRNGFTVHSNNVTLAEALGQSGYRTAGFIGSFALESRFGISQGFSHWDEAFEQFVDGRNHDQNQRPAGAVTDAVLDWLDGVDADEAPLFLFAHYFDPHASYAPPAEFARAHVPDGASLAGTFEDVERSILTHQVERGSAPLGLARQIERGLDRAALMDADGQPLGDDRRLAGLYAGEVDYVDVEIGRLLDGLAQRGIGDDALIVVTADHGETFWEHADVWNHGLWVYETTVRVPLIVRAPGMSNRGRVIDTPVSTVDVAPTILSAVGIDAPPRRRGRRAPGGLG